MKFMLEVEVETKKDSSKMLNSIIKRASDAVLKEKAVKMVDVKGKVVEVDE